MSDLRDRYPTTLDAPARPRLRLASTGWSMPVALDTTPPPGQQPAAPLLDGVAILEGPRARRPGWTERLAIPVAVGLALLGPLLAWTAHRAVASRTEQRRGAELERLALDRAQRVREQVVASIEALHAIRGLYEASEAVTREEFATFAGHVRARHPAVRLVAWAPRAVGEAAVPERFVVNYAEPPIAQPIWLGADVTARTVAAQAISRTLGSGEAVLSDAHELSCGTGRAMGALLALLVPAAADRGPGGVLLLGLDGAALLAAAAEHSSAEAVASLSARLLDADAQGRRTPLHAPTAAAAEASPALLGEVPLDVAGQDWRLVAAATPALFERVAGTSPWLAALAALLAWELLVASIFALGLGWRGQALRGQARMMGHMLRSLAEGVLVTDRHGRVRLTNDAARGLLAASAPEGPERLPLERRLLQADGRTPLAAEGQPLARALEGEVAPAQEARLRIHGEGEPPWLSISARPLLDERGALHGGVLLLRDVSEQRRMHARETEMRLAGEVQQSLYPRSTPRAPGLDVAALVVPAEVCCGDYYDWMTRPDGSLLLAIGDVSGHGAGPAIVMAEVRAYVRALAAAGLEPADILRRINATLAEDLPVDMFVTLLLLAVDPVSRQLSYANAGHEAGLLVGADGELKAELHATGPMLGPYPNAAFRQGRPPRLAFGDVIALVTDGVVECPDRDGARFEEQRVLSVVRASRHERASEVVQALRSALEEHAGGRPPRDDVTLLVLKG